LLDNKFNGMNLGGLNEIRNEHPVFKSSSVAQIPFNSAHKFALFVRDMAPKIEQPQTAKDNLCVFMKGAPEKIIARCDKILVDGEE